jgi:hypothetical protein
MLQRQRSHLNGRTLGRRQVKSLTFSVSGFAFSDIAKICIYIILYDFCLLKMLFKHGPLRNGSINKQAVARQRPATIEELLEASLLAASQLAFSEDASREAEGYLLLGAVTRPRLVKTWKTLCVLQYSNL